MKAGQIVSATVAVRRDGAGYYARCNGKAASCTWSAKVAAQKAAMKAAGWRHDHRGIFLAVLNGGTGYEEIKFEQTGIEMNRYSNDDLWLAQLKGPPGRET